jgi:hypothetical protein
MGDMKKLLLTVLLVFPPCALACSFAPGYERFTPAPASFEPRTENDRLAVLPAPRVDTVRVQRGTAASGGPCGDLGRLTLVVDWPRSSSYRLDEVGFYFRVVGGRQPDRIFPPIPITGRISGQRAQFFFVWVDGHSPGQAPLDLEVEVFAVNKGLEIGPARRFRITDAMRGR